MAEKVKPRVSQFIVTIFNDSKPIDKLLLILYHECFDGCTGCNGDDPDFYQSL